MSLERGNKLTPDNAVPIKPTREHLSTKLLTTLDLVVAGSDIYGYDNSLQVENPVVAQRERFYVAPKQPTQDPAVLNAHLRKLIEGLDDSELEVREAELHDTAVGATEYFYIAEAACFEMMWATDKTPLSDSVSDTVLRKYGVDPEAQGAKNKLWLQQQTEIKLYPAQVLADLAYSYSVTQHGKRLRTHPRGNRNDLESLYDAITWDLWHRWKDGIDLNEWYRTLKGRFRTEGGPYERKEAEVAQDHQFKQFMGKELALQRARFGFTQRDAARILEMSVAQVIGMEQGTILTTDKYIDKIIEEGYKHER